MRGRQLSRCAREILHQDYGLEVSDAPDQPTTDRDRGSEPGSPEPPGR